MTIGQAVVLALAAIGLAAWASAVFFYFKAVRDTNAGGAFPIPRSVLHFLVKPDAWTPASQRSWRLHLACLGLFAASIFLIWAVVTVFGVQPLQL
jgi:hypothetical protein